MHKQLKFEEGILNGEDEIEPIGKYLSIAYRALMARLDEKLSDYDINVGTFHFLFPLYKREGLNQKDLCEIFNLNKGVVGRGVQKLEKNGYITRRDDPDDKRKNLIYLTEKSKELKSEFIDVLKSTEKETRGNLSEESIKNFLEILKKICQNLGVDSLKDIEEV